MAWALHVLTMVTAGQGQMSDTLSLFERALTVTESDPALTDLRVLLQINQAVTLGSLDRYEEAITTARDALRVADQAGTMIRQVQAHSALGQLHFDTGRWDEALAEVEALPEQAKEPMAACSVLGIAAVIRFHRGEIAAAQRDLAAAAPHAERTGTQVIGPLILARSLQHEHSGDPAAALAALTTGFAGNTSDLDEIEDLLPDAARLASQTGELRTAQELAGHAPLAAESEIPHRQANALYCRALLDHDSGRLLSAADRYHDASRPLLSAKALESAAEEFLHNGDHDQARATFIRAADIYTSLGALVDIARLQAGSARLL
jgi:tetratricopeptide (TPR) repeat protein